MRIAGADDHSVFVVMSGDNQTIVVKVELESLDLSWPLKTTPAVPQFKPEIFGESLGGLKGQEFMGDLKAGVVCSSFKGIWGQDIPCFDVMKPVRVIVLEKVMRPPSDLDDIGGFRFDLFIKVEKNGRYNISPKGGMCRLKVDGYNFLVNRDTKDLTSCVMLKAGWHKLQLDVVLREEQNELGFEVEGPFEMYPHLDPCVNTFFHEAKDNK